MFFINAADFNGFGRGIQCHFQLYRGGRGLQLRKMVQILFCGHYGNLGVCRIVESGRADFSIQRTGKLQSLVTGLIQQAQGVVNRLGDSVLRHHAKAAVKFLRERMQFLKNITEAPHAGTLQCILGAESRAHIVGGNLAGIIARRAKGGAGVPLGVVNRQTVGLLPHLQGGITQQVAVQICSFGIFRHNAAEHRQQTILRLQACKELRHIHLILLLDFFGGLVVVLLRLVAHLADGVPRILVRCDKVHRQRMLLAVLHKGRNPFAVAGGRTTDLQLIIHRLDGLHRDFIQAEVFFLRAVKERRLEVRFVPNLKEPAFHFLLAVAVQQKTDEFLNMCLPLRLIFGRRNAGLPVKCTASRALCHLAGHKAQFHKRFHAGFQYIVIHKPRQPEAAFIERYLLCARHGHNRSHCVIGVHIIAENSVKAYTLNA